VVRIPGYRSRGPEFDSGATRFSEKRIRSKYKLENKGAIFEIKRTQHLYVYGEVYVPG
jgi:hypothetical protein